MIFLLDLIKTFVLGIVEGITEWLPISSTGHMLLVDKIFTLSQPEAFKEMFFVVIQLGAIIAVVVIFWKKMWPFQKNSNSQYVINMDIMQMWFKVAVACIPSAVLGFFLDDWLEEHFGGPVTIALMLIIYGFAFIVVENWNKTREPKIKKLSGISYSTAFLIGLFQVLSMIPGTSRSGATIIGALIIGVSRTAAAEFTFFLAVPTMLGASLLKLVKFGFNFNFGQFIILIFGMAVAFIVSLLCIRWLMSFIKKHDFKPFGLYRIILGALVLLLACFGVFA